MKAYISIILLISVVVMPVNGQLVGKWTFNENSGNTAYDSSGNNLSGKLVNYVPYITSPGTDAISLDGIEDFVDFGKNSNFVITGAFTIEAWILLNGVTGEAMVLGTDTGSYGITCYNNRIYAYGGATGGNNISFSPALGQWVHIAVTSDPAQTGVTLKLYADGVLVASRSSTGLYPADSTGLSLLCGTDRTKTSSLNADIDELRLYNNALSQAQVEASFSAGAEKYLIQNCEDVKAKGYVLAADLDGDCTVDLNDFVSLAQSWLE